MRSIQGQPGLYRTNDEYALLGDYLDAGHLAIMRPHLPGTLQGLGDAAAVNVLISSADNSYKALVSSLTPLLNQYPGLDSGVINAIKTAVTGLGPGFYASIGTSEYAMLFRFFLQGAALNLNLAHALMNGPSASNATTQAQATALATTAKNLVDALFQLIQGAQTTEAAITSTIQSAGNIARKIVGLNGLGSRGLGALGLEPVELVAGIIAVFIVAAVIVYCFTQYEAGQQAAAAADSACAHAAAAGTPCTATQWSQIHDAAVRAASSLTILPDLGRAVQSAGNLVFWGGLLAVGAVLAYGAWTTYPAASAVRSRLEQRARR